MMFGIVSLFDSRQVEHDLSLYAHSLGDDHGYVSVSKPAVQGLEHSGSRSLSVCHMRLAKRTVKEGVYALIKR